MALKLIQGKQINVNLTGSFSGSFTGNLIGTSSWASNASSSSYALSSSFATSASWAPMRPGGADRQIQFNSGSILTGTGSFAFNYQSQSLQQGFAVTASGLYSHAEGNNTRAIGQASHAEGSFTLASGLYAHAEGESTVALGVQSHTEGVSTQTVGSYSHAEGSGTTATGNASHAEGQQAQAIGDYSHAEGNNTQAIGQASHAEGFQTKVGIETAFNARTLGIVNGLVTINDSYGDVTAYFTPGGYLYIYDAEFVGFYNYLSTLIDTVSFGDTNTLIQLVDTSLNTPEAYVGDLTYLLNNQTFGGDQVIPGSYSHTEGGNTQTLGEYSHAEGISTQAVGQSSHAEGQSTQAIGDSSHTEGQSTQAIGVGSHAEGASTIANGNYSHAEGISTQAIGNYSHAEGASTIASGNTSHAEGHFTTASGNYSHAEGRETMSSGSHSHAEGYFSLSSGEYSHAEGVSTQTVGTGSHAEGQNTRANGDYSHAEGSSTQANDIYSHAEGRSTRASAPYSHAEGWGTITSGSYQHAQGTFNITSTAPAAFIIGNGTSNSARSNLLFASGSQVQVTGSVLATQGFTGSLFGTSSWAISSSQAVSASFSRSGSYAVSASYSQNSTSSSYASSATNANNATSASFAITAQNANNAATASNILGGKAPHIPFFITDTTLATSSLYQSGSSTVIINQDAATTANPEALYVWQPSTTSFNVISGKGNLNNYLQLNIQNTNQGTNASSDVVATADNGNENINYIDMGINGENYNANFIGVANDAYVYSTGRHLHIGNASNFPVQIFAGGSDVDIHNKLELNPNNQHSMTGSLDVSGSVKAFSFTGSLQGNATTATTATTATSASHATVADSATYAATAGNGGVTQITAGSGVTLIPSNGQGNVTVIATGTGGVTIISGSIVTGSFTNTTSFTFNHNLSTRTPIITVFDSNYNQIIPENIQLVNTSSAVITFPTPESGFAIGSTGGTTGTALSASYALLAEYANTASFYAETDPVYIAQKPTLATTGSNTFRGTQIVTGSLLTSGSNTLVGNTTLTGSLNISGSTTQSGNNTLIGTTTLTGSIQIAGDIIPQLSSSFDLGSVSNPWRSIYVQSGSISIQSDIPGGIPAVISNANGNVTFAGAGFQLKSGSFVPFEISSSARTIIRVPNIPANDVGGLSIIGSSDGSYQGVTNPGGLLHLTSNDGQSSRITSDAFGTTAVVSYVGRKARGTAASPLPVQSGDTLTRISTIGWTGPEYGFLMSASSTVASTAIETVALENFTTSSFGTKHTFYNAPLGGTIRTLSAQIDTTGITIPSTSRLFGTASWAANAQTASYVLNAVSSSFASTASYINPLNQNVIITGSLKVSGSLTEIGDTVLTGSLTLSSGSALNINDGFYVNGNKQFNYGQFSSTQTQSGSADTAYSATFNTIDFSQGVSLVSGSRITVSNSGLYNIQFSTQLHTTANQAVDFSIWFAMTGSNIANSNTDFTVEKIAGGGYAVAALNLLTQIQSGSYVELKYSKTTAQGQLQAKGTQATPTRPATPSVILTVTQVA